MMKKVVLLIGNDDNVLQSLAEGLARRGCDIALAAQKMPLEIANAIRDSVQALGRRFLYLGALITIQKAELAVAEIKRELGGIDFLVDMTDRSIISQSDQVPPQPRLWLSKTILQELSS